jgi:hypothetical protein
MLVHRLANNYDDESETLNRYALKAEEYQALRA